MVLAMALLTHRKWVTHIPTSPIPAPCYQMRPLEKVSTPAQDATLVPVEDKLPDCCIKAGDDVYPFFSGLLLFRRLRELHHIPIKIRVPYTIPTATTTRTEKNKSPSRPSNITSSFFCPCAEFYKNSNLLFYRSSVFLSYLCNNILVFSVDSNRRRICHVNNPNLQNATCQ